MVILGVGLVPGRVVWLAAAVVGPVRVGPYRPNCLYGLQTVLLNRFVYYRLVLSYIFFFLQIKLL